MSPTAVDSSAMPFGSDQTSKDFSISSKPALGTSSCPSGGVSGTLSQPAVKIPVSGTDAVESSSHGAAKAGASSCSTLPEGCAFRSSHGGAKIGSPSCSAVPGEGTPKSSHDALKSGLNVCPSSCSTVPGGGVPQSSATSVSYKVGSPRSFDPAASPSGANEFAQSIRGEFPSGSGPGGADGGSASSAPAATTTDPVESLLDATASTDSSPEGSWSNTSKPSRFAATPQGSG